MARSVILACCFGVASLALSSPLALAGDAAKGADVFKQKCATCHTIEKGAGNGLLGPNLFGVVGRSAASMAGFGYSKPLKDSKIVWADDKLKEWVVTPQKVVPGTKMMLIHAPDAQQADDVVAYLNTKK
jgi:cytochrome c